VSDERHQELRLLVQADVDGELAARDGAAVAAHLAACGECRSLHVSLSAAKQAMLAAAPRFAAPEELRRRVAASIEAKTGPAPLPTRSAGRFEWSWLGGSFGAGALLAAALLLLVFVPRDAGVEDAVLDGHVRALQPGHLFDVPSSDRHTVKPWFDGKLDFAPPVKELSTQGFPLQGGRLDYIAGRPAAALVYGRARHVIDLFIWPNAGGREAAPAIALRNGYNLVGWKDGAMNYWAVSDLNPEELGEFVRDWRAAP